MKSVTALIALPAIIVLALFLGFRGIYEENLWVDFAILELQLHQLLDGRILHFGVHTKDGLFHLGPSIYYSLFPTYWVCGGASTSLFIGALVINILALLGWAFLLNKFPPSIAAVAPPIILLSLWHLGENTLVSPWNVHLIIIPFSVFLLLSANLSTGNFRYLPWVVGVASWIVQAYLGPAIPLALICCTALFLAVWQSGRELPVKWVIVGCLVAGIMWGLPLLEWNNLQNVYHFFRAHSSVPQANAGKWIAQGAAFLPLRMTGDLIPVGLESLATIGVFVLLCIASAVTWKKEELVSKAGIITSIGIVGLCWSAFSSPVDLDWGYYVMWGWGLGTTAAVIILGTAVHEARLTGTWLTVLRCGCIVCSLAIVVAWTLSIDPTTLPPEKRPPRAVAQKGDPPELLFDKFNYWNTGASTVTHMYKQRKPFTTEYWKWPFNLPPSYKPRSK